MQEPAGAAHQVPHVRTAQALQAGPQDPQGGPAVPQEGAGGEGIGCDGTVVVRRGEPLHFATVISDNIL